MAPPVDANPSAPEPSEDPRPAGVLPAAATPSTPRAPWTTGRKVGVMLILAGIALVLVGVFYVLDSAWGEQKVTSFAQRRSYNQVKVAVHETFPVAILFGLAGFFTAWTGVRMVEAPSSED